MKLSVAVAPDNAPPSAFVVFRGLENSIRTAAALGYNGIELAVSSAKDAEVPRLSRWLSENHMEVSAVSTGLVYAARGLSLLETPDAAAPVFRELIDLAADYGKKVNIGRARGFKKELSLDAAADKFRAVAEPIAEYAGKKGVTLLLEPVNRYEIDWIHSVADGAYVLERTGLKNMGLMPDVFHMNIEDQSIRDSFIINKKYVNYVHLADSNRHAPGWGHLNFDEVFSALNDSGYNDWVSVEMLPVPAPEKAAKQAADFLLPFLSKFSSNGTAG